MSVKKICLNPLSKGFVISKPMQNDAYDEEEIYELEKKNRLIITRKHNGWKLFAVKAKNQWKIYTDGIRNVTAYLPHIVSELKKLRTTDECILAGEGVADFNESDNSKIARILLTKNPAEAIRKQKKSGLIKFMCFDLICGGSTYAMHNAPYHERIETAAGIIGAVHKHLGTVEILRVTYNEAKQLVIEKNWEGLVLYDREFITTFRLDGGNPKRAWGCYKWKPKREDDFVASDWRRSKKRKNRIKDVLIGQYDPETKALFDCGYFGNFDEKTRGLLLLKDFPFVIQLQFESRHPSGKLQSARFVCFREDKKAENCIAPKHFEKSTPAE